MGKYDTTLYWLTVWPDNLALLSATYAQTPDHLEAKKGRKEWVETTDHMAFTSF